MDVLVVGGTGLISTGIVRKLVAAGHEVTCFTRGETEAALPERVSFVHGDRHDDAALAAARDAVEPDCVIDAVCFAPETAEAAVSIFEGEIEQYVFTSTVDVYHRPPATQPISEDAARVTEVEAPPVSGYAEDKAVCEDVFRDAHDRGAFEVTIVRPWSTYGEGGPVLHSLGLGTYYLDRLRVGEPIVQHGDGQGLWGPCHRDDVARTFANAVGEETAYGEAYHVTSEEVITWQQYHATVAEALGAPEPTLVTIPTDQLAAAVPERTAMLLDHFRFSTVFDNAKARRDLDFEYTIPFREGVERTIDWLDEHDEIDPWDSENDDAIVDAWRGATGHFRGQFGTAE